MERSTNHKSNQKSFKSKEDKNKNIVYNILPDKTESAKPIVKNDSKFCDQATPVPSANPTDIKKVEEVSVAKTPVKFEDELEEYLFEPTTVLSKKSSSKS